MGNVAKDKHYTTDRKQKNRSRQDKVIQLKQKGVKSKSFAFNDLNLQEWIVLAFLLLLTSFVLTAYAYTTISRPILEEISNAKLSNTIHFKSAQYAKLNTIKSLNKEKAIWNCGGTYTEIPIPGQICFKVNFSSGVK